MTWKPLKVLFVGDTPSSKNKRQEVPFVGTVSYKRLLRWIGELDLDIQNCILSNSRHIDLLVEHYDYIFLLGKKATKNTIISWCASQNFDDIKKIIELPHPSPRNRKLNDLKYEKKILKEVKDKLYGSKTK